MITMTMSLLSVLKFPDSLNISTTIIPIPLRSREVGVGRSQAEADSAVCTDDLEHDRKDIEPRLFGIYNAVSLPSVLAVR